MLTEFFKSLVGKIASESKDLQDQRKAEVDAAVAAATSSTSYQHFTPPGPKPTITPWKKPAIVVMYEGALASTSWRDKYIDADVPDWETYWKSWQRDRVNPQILEMLQLLDGDTKIIIMCQHAGGWYKDIEEWLKQNGVPRNRIITNYNFSDAKDISRSKLLANLENTCIVQMIFEADPVCMEMERALGYEVTFVEDPNLAPRAATPADVDEDEFDSYSTLAMQHYMGYV